MARLPQPGGDVNTWGDLLNDYLLVEHNADGTLRQNGSIGSKMQLRGDWTAVTAYTTNDVVQMHRASFICLVAHTSSPATGGITAAFQTDFSGSRWKQLSPRMSWYDVRDYGAKMDNGNDTSAVQATVDACAAAGGGTVFIPNGMCAVTTIVLKNRVWLRGAGMYSTTVRCLSNTNGPVIKNFVSPDGIIANGEFCAVMDMKIDGNKANNTGTGSHCIYFNTNPLYTKATNDDWFDTHHLCQNLMLLNAAGCGYFSSGRSEERLINVYAEKCNSGGISPSFDAFLEGCSAGANGTFGFSFTHGSIMANNCKAFINGNIDASQGAGFYTAGLAVALTMNGCIAQNNFAQGFYLKNTTGAVMSGCVADSNNYGTGNAADAYTGVELDGTSNCIVDFISQQGFQNGVQIGNQASALRIKNGSNHNDIRVTTYAQAGYTLGPTYTADSSLLVNRLAANGALVNPLPTLPGNADVTISTPSDGQTLQYSATLSKWVNSSAPVGTFTSGILGDGTDGSAILDGVASVPWATLAGGTYSMTRDALTTGLTVQSGVTLVCSGFRIFCQGTATNNGTINANGNNATSSTGAGQSTPRSLGTGKSGGAGNATAGSTGGQGAFGVGNGGAGGNGTGANTGGTAVSSLTGLNWVIRDVQGIATGIISYAAIAQPIAGGSGGSGGGGDGTNKGGGGGSGGSIIAILARSFANNSVLTATGGNGFAPTIGNCGGGAGGGGGGIFIYTVNPSVNNGTTIVTSGIGAAGSGTGTAGANGTAGTVLFVQLQ